MIYFALKYRERKGHKAEPTGHNLPLEIGWTVAPIFILVFLFHKGFEGYMNMHGRPGELDGDPRQRQAVGLGVRVPERRRQTRSSTSRCTSRSSSSWRRATSFTRSSCPRLRVKRDVVPGHVHVRLVRGHARRPGRHRVRRVLRRPRQGTPSGNELPVRGQTDGALGDALDALRRDRRGVRQVPDEHRRQVRDVHGQGPAVPRQRRRRAGPEALREEGLPALPHDRRAPSSSARRGRASGASRSRPTTARSRSTTTTSASPSSSRRRRS